MVKIKICGLKNPNDIGYVNQFKPDFIGFVFATSPRKVDFDTASQLSFMLNQDIIPVGVFVNESIEKITQLVHHKVIQMVQLHGDEDIVYINELKKHIHVPLIKAVRVRTTQDILVAQKLPVDYLLLDTFVKGMAGGSGQVFNHDLIPSLEKPFFLAGGLNPDNVPSVLTKIQPFAVDVSGGVETNGIKDKDKIEKMIQAVRSRYEKR